MNIPEALSSARIDSLRRINKAICCLGIFLPGIISSRGSLASGKPCVLGMWELGKAGSGKKGLGKEGRNSRGFFFPLVIHPLRDPRELEKGEMGRDLGM